MARIELLGMRFHAFHGCLESERRGGNEFVVDFSGELPAEAAELDDSLEHTVDYSAVYRLIAEEMAVPSNLLERVARRIADRVGEAFPSLEHYEISVSKKNPPVGGDCAWAKVSIRR